MVHFKPGNIEWLKMQTRKRFLQETKKCFKVRLALEDCISPMKARETFKKDLHVPSPFTLQAAWCYSSQSEISSFPSKKLKFFFSQHSFSFAVKNGLFELRGMQNNRCYWKKKETVQNFGLETKNWGKKNKYIFLVFNPQMKFWVFGYIKA